MDTFFSAIQQASPLQMLLTGLALLMVWFLPAVLALVFNPRQAKLIAIACIPSVFSVIAWGAVLIWAVTGKALEKYLPKKIQQHL